MDGRRQGKTTVRVRTVDVDAGVSRARRDDVATEEPLAIRLQVDGITWPVAITMRTPGADFELAVGFLFAEGIIGGGSDVSQVRYCVDVDQDQQYNVVTVDLRPGTPVDPARFARGFGVSSACGVCGKERLDQVERQGVQPVAAGPAIDAAVITALPAALRAGQGLFAKTGGLHAAGLFTAAGELLAVREDVGRHNAVDKLVGWALLEGRLPLSDSIVFVSGRTSFEIAQKCAAAGAPVLAAVSAPSSLAIETARRFGMTLLGFVRDDHFNVYHDPGRIAVALVDQVASATVG